MQLERTMRPKDLLRCCPFVVVESLEVDPVPEVPLDIVLPEVAVELET